MAGYPYTTAPGRIEPLLKKIREIGIPPKANNQWLASIGFKSINERSLLNILRSMGFIDGEDKPTETWTQYRGPNHRQLLASAIQMAFRDLFNIYQDAQIRADGEIEDIVRENIKAGKDTIKRVSSTFRNLCSMADFSTKEPISQIPQDVTPEKKNEVITQYENDDPPEMPSLHINLQVHISSDASSEQIDTIFESMVKHLYRRRNR